MGYFIIIEYLNIAHPLLLKKANIVFKATEVPHISVTQN